MTGLGSPLTTNYTWTPSIQKLDVAVNTERARYPKWSNIAINVDVADASNSAPLQGASVNVTVSDIHGRKVWSGLGTTNSNGQVFTVYKLVFDAQMGYYGINASVSLSGYQTGLGQTTFFSIG